MTPRVPPLFHLLAKPTGAACNLACDYCFFLSKEQLYPGSAFCMSDDVLEAYVKQLLGAQPGPDVTVAWQGGDGQRAEARPPGRRRHGVVCDA